jgi:hypothetical protein
VQVRNIGTMPGRRAPSHWRIVWTQSLPHAGITSVNQTAKALNDYALLNSSGSLAMLLAIRHASGLETNRRHRCCQGRRSGHRHEAVAIHSRNFRRHALRRTIRSGAKLSVVRILWPPFRCHELRVFNVSTMLGNHKRDWWELWGQSNVSARAEIISVD